MFGSINITKSNLSSAKYKNTLRIWQKKIKYLRTVSHNKAKKKQVQRHQRLNLKTEKITKRLSQLKPTFKMNMESACQIIQLCKKKIK